MTKIKAQIITRKIEGEDVQILRLPFHANLKVVGEEDGKMIIEGYASVFGNVDSYYEVVDPGAFTDFLRSYFPRYPKLIWAHNWEDPIGITLEAREDERGLFVRGELTAGVQRAEEAYKLIKAGAITDLSFGFRVDQDMIDQNTGVRHLTKISIYEWSPVLVGANGEALITAVKSAIGREFTAEEVKAFQVKEDGSQDQPANNEDNKPEGDNHSADPEPKPEDAPAPEPAPEGGESGKSGSPAEEKVGKVLSAKNRAVVESAIAAAQDLTSALEALLSAADESESASSETAVDQRGRGEQGAKVIKLIIRDARQADKAIGKLLLRAKKI